MYEEMIYYLNRCQEGSGCSSYRAEMKEASYVTKREGKRHTGLEWPLLEVMQSRQAKSGVT